MPPRTAILFDLDGTLLDSEGDLCDAANRARAALGLAPLPEADIRGHIGYGLRHLLERVVPESLHGRLDEARAAFVAWYGAHLLDRSRPYEGAGEALRALRAHPLGLVTNKPSMFLDPLLEGLGWRGLFGAVIGGDTLPERKPHPRPLLYAIERLGATPERAVYVGDSEVDRATAAAAGVRFIAVAWGRIAPAMTGTLARLSDLPARLEGSP